MKTVPFWPLNGTPPAWGDAASPASAGSIVASTLTWLELVDAPDLKSGAARRAGSSPAVSTHSLVV